MNSNKAPIAPQVHVSMERSPGASEWAERPANPERRQYAAGIRK